MTPTQRIVDIASATVRAALSSPLVLGNMTITSREYTVVRVVGSSDTPGYSFTLTRGAPLAEIVMSLVAPAYLHREIELPKARFFQVQGANLASLSAGIGLRALSLVDLATWDMVARSFGRPVGALVGSADQAISLPATAIIGYPPTLEPTSLARQVTSLYNSGWRRFKLPISPTSEQTYARLRATEAAAPGAWIGLDAAWSFETAQGATKFLSSVPVELGWLEDAFPPTESTELRELRKKVRVPLAYGDEHGGTYYHAALIEPPSIDWARVDLTCMGGITGGLDLIEKCTRAGIPVAPHMAGHVHSQVMSSLGLEVPIEWGFPGELVDPFEASLGYPTIRDGNMEAVHASAGFGCLLNKEWLLEQDVDDPQDIIGSC